MAFYKASKKCLKSELSTTIAETAWLGQLFDDLQVQAADLPERLSARDAVIQSIVEDFCTLLGLSLRTLAENSNAGLKKSASEAFRAGSTASQVLTDVAVHVI